MTFTTTQLHGCMIGSFGGCNEIFHIFQPWKSCLQVASVDMSCGKNQSTSLMDELVLILHVSGMRNFTVQYVVIVIHNNMAQYNTL